jgi:hypothetical protein
MPASLWTAARWGVGAGLFAAVTAIEFALVRPLQAGPAGPDAAASVLFFDRITSGRHLEVFVNNTAKPLLTVVLGGLHAISGDWRAGALATVIVTALGIVLASELVRRVANLEAAIFAGVALIGLISLQAETSWSYGLPWAFACWMAAGLLLVGPHPRFGAAGLVLLVGGLARAETFILIGVATLILGWMAVRGPRPPIGAPLVMTGWLAIVGLCAHDLLLTGDPLWWTRVAAHSVALNDGRARSLGGVVFMSGSLLWSSLPLTIAACLGTLHLLHTRRWVAAVGLIAIGPLVVVYTWILAIARINVLTHYLHPVYLAIVLGASVFVGLVLKTSGRAIARRFRRAGGRPAHAIAALVAFALAVGLVRPYALLSPSGRRSIALEADIASRLTSVEPILARARPADPPGTTPVPGPMGAPDPTRIRLYVPAHRVPRLALDLGLALTQIGRLDPSRVDLARGYPPVGAVVYIDGFVEAASLGRGTTALQVSAPTRVDGVVVVPIISDPIGRWWVVRIDPAP